MKPFTASLFLQALNWKQPGCPTRASSGLYRVVDGMGKVCLLCGQPLAHGLTSTPPPRRHSPGQDAWLGRFRGSWIRLSGALLWGAAVQ